MAQTGPDRLEKYKNKFDPEVARLRATATKDLAEKKQLTHLINMAEKDEVVRGIMDTAGISPFLAVMYQSFSKKLYSLTNKFTGVTLTNQIEQAKYRWICEGATEAVLDDIIAIYTV